MKKEEIIRRHGQEAYEKMRQQSRDWNKKYPERVQENKKRWAAANPDKDKACQHEGSRKGGKYYERYQKYRLAGIPHARHLIREGHGRRWRPFKQIIAPDSQLHHEWLPETADYRGVALVEKDQHMHGIIDVIQIMEGKITLLTEAEIKGDKKKDD